jgi:aspartyl protease family protein
MLSSGVRQAVAMAGGWLFAFACLVFSVLHYDEIKTITRDMLGLPAPAPQAVRNERPAANGRAPAVPGRVIELRASQNGHYFASAEINGRPIDVMIDTGATIVALSWEDASRAGLFIRDRDYTQRVQTANGVGRIAPVTLDRVSIGPITVRNVPAAVSEPGALGTSLLGMSFLGRLQRVDMRSGVLVLSE